MYDQVMNDVCNWCISFLYKASDLWSKEQERSIRWNDRDININWPLKDLYFSEPRLSEKDSNAPFLKNADVFN